MNEEKNNLVQDEEERKQRLEQEESANKKALEDAANRAKSLEEERLKIEIDKLFISINPTKNAKQILGFFKSTITAIVRLSG